MIVPRDKDGHALPEGSRIDDERKAWKIADRWIAENKSIVFVSFHDNTGKEFNVLWRTSCYRGWTPTPERKEL